jgi:PAS domain S-box-containing protein
VDVDRLSVVLVDDSADVRRLVRRTLEASGLFEVVAECADGEEAISLAYRHQPDLMLLDTSMPKMDGLEALPAVRALSPDTAVVMFTGFEDVQLAARARELGAAAFVEKSTPLEQVPVRLAGLFHADAQEAAQHARSQMRLTDVPIPPEVAATQAAQQVLDQHTASFRDLFDQAAIGMATLTTAGRIVRANRALAELVSSSPAELVGEDYGRLTSGRGDELDRGLASITRHDEDLAIFEHDLPHHPDEPPRGMVQVTLAPIRGSDGEVLYMFAQVQDVTRQRATVENLRRTEERFRLLVRSVGEYAIYLLDVDGNVISWNVGAQRIKGYEAEEVLGRSFRIFYLPEQQENGHPEHNLRVALRLGQITEEGWRVRKDGSRFWASVVISPVFDDHRRHIGFAKVTRDRTDQRVHEGELQDLMSQRTEVLALTAHELRNPAAVIDGSAGLLQRSWSEMSEPDRSEVLDGIRGSARRLHRLAGDLATASRLHAEAFDLERVEVDLAVALAAAVGRASGLHPGVAIRSDVPVRLMVNVDAVRLDQSLDNLIDNAVRHGTPPVLVSATLEGDVVRICVADAGGGIPDELTPRLFGMFASAGQHRATGLGLYLVREIARRHGGEAEYEPPEGGSGARFVVTLPRGA